MRRVFCPSRRRHLTSLGLVASATLGGCGGETPAGSSTSGNTTTTTASTVISLPITLTALPAAWDDQGSSLDVASMSVKVGDPAPVFTGSSTTVNWTNTTSVPASSCTTTGGVRSCSLTISNIETKDYSIGMLVQVGDNRGSFTGAAWTGLATGVPQSTVTGLRGASASASAALTSTVFAMTSDGASQLGTWSGVQKVDLIGNGAMLGVILDKNLQPVKGAQLTVSGQGLQLIYANGDFTAAGTPGPTATLPYFVVTPSSAQVVKSTGWTIAAPAPATATWSVPLVGSAPNYLVMIPFVGQ